MLKKIGLHLSAIPISGGAFQYSLAMLDAIAQLPQDRYTITVSYADAVWEPILKSQDISGIRVHDGLSRYIFDRYWRNLMLPTALWRKVCPLFQPLAKALIKENCDLWVFPSQDTLIYQIPVPALGTIFDLMHRYESSFPEVSAFGRYGRRERHYKNLCHWAKGLIVESEMGKQHVIESYEIAPAKVHALPMLPPKYILENRTDVDVKKKYNLPDKYLFYPAQFWEHKNHKRLVKAVAMAKPKIGNLKLVLVGAPKNAYQTTKKLIADLNLAKDILILGYVSDADMSRIYRSARALVMPTFFGPTNIPPLEAFAVGCPVAVSRIYAMPEQFGDAALFFDPNSVDEIAAAIHRLWIDDRLCRFLADKGRGITAAWGPRQFSKKLESIIRTVL